MHVTLRQEVKSDYKDTFCVIKEAFGREYESLLVERLRCGAHFIPELSLVAEADGKVVGHILFTRMGIRAANAFYETLCLAPTAVLPEYQKQGIGEKLIRAGLEKSKEMGFKSVIVLGHQEYYPKFGFRPAAQWGIQSPFEVPPEAFMALELQEYELVGKSGTVEYPQEFFD